MTRKSNQGRSYLPRIYNVHFEITHSLDVGFQEPRSKLADALFLHFAPCLLGRYKPYEWVAAFMDNREYQRFMRVKRSLSIVKGEVRAICRF